MSGSGTKPTWLALSEMSTASTPEVASSKVAQIKSRPKAALNSNLMCVDHAAINAGFDFGSRGSSLPK